MSQSSTCESSGTSVPSSSHAPWLGLGLGLGLGIGLGLGLGLGLGKP